MKLIPPLEEFLENLSNEATNSLNEATINRSKELANLQDSNFLNRYAIQITVSCEAGLLLEHEQYKKFQKGTDLFYKHPEQPNIPVQAHYHVVDGKSKKEIYAVNMDGTAHHRANKNFQVPKKQADELRKLGVAIPADNILESVQLELNEDGGQHHFTFFIVIE